MGRLEAPGDELHAWMVQEEVGRLLEPYAARARVRAAAGNLSGGGVVAAAEVAADEALEASCM